MSDDTGCEACREDAQALTPEEIRQQLERSAGWELLPRGNMPVIAKRYCFRNFAEALAFTNRVGELAERKDHHPELVTEWGAVTVSWWSHKIRGLHELDFVMARACNDLHGV
jgi:4a-hydroxytetrahydrobiopterin dehydratase